MTPGELLSWWRRDVGDTAKPYLWSDDDVLGYISDAQLQFCRDTDGLLDSTTTEVTRLAVVPTTAELTLHSSVKAVIRAHRLDTGRPVTITTEDQLNADGFYFDGATGPVRALVLGADAGSVRVWPVSNETVTIRLTVFRFPLVPITDPDQAFEVDSTHHLDLLHWVNYRAYNRHDAETFDPKRAAGHNQAFAEYCARAKAEQRRRRATFQPVRYGGY